MTRKSVKAKPHELHGISNLEKIQLVDKVINL